jgi:hypothetical protein
MIMRVTRKVIAITLAAAASAIPLALPTAYAGPIIIRDEMISDKGISPSLGRGYSLATNTFQSICLTGIKKTTPSFDFVYSFEELGAQSTKPDLVASAKGSSGASGGPQITMQTEEPSTKFYIKVSISMDLYYHSLDETASELGMEPKNLLEKRDIPGFFDACGVYYTRTINRRATYLSIFSYESKTGPGSSRDTEKEIPFFFGGFLCGRDLPGFRHDSIRSPGRDGPRPERGSVHSGLQAG